MVDLSEASRQPMVDPTGRLAITYNGEVYNYRELVPQLAASGWRFRSSGDMEVVLAAYATWGEAAWERLEGMFAIIGVELNSQRLHLPDMIADIKVPSTPEEAAREVAADLRRPAVTWERPSRLVPVSAFRLRPTWAGCGPRTRAPPDSLPTGSAPYLCLALPKGPEPP